MRRTVRARKVTPKVKDGTVQKKHRHALTAHAGYAIVRHTASRGYRHIIRQKDIRDFIDIIPDAPAVTATSASTTPASSRTTE